MRVCNPNAVWDLEPQQIYRIHENEKKRLYSKRVLDIEHGTFTPLVFTTTGGMGTNNNDDNLILILRAFHEMIKRALHDFYL